ncbi:MAG: serine protease DegS [Gammaproteobacteria bacterium]|nr:MAG: serine protease DegS [Gammaproteobacteria bacterium]TND06264.1 MAG: serine protease DegS [Gammaproteobacteria bacterium]
MEIKKLLPYLAQGVIVGAAIGFVALLLFRQDSQPQHAVTQLTENGGEMSRLREAPRHPDAAPASYADAVAAATPAVVNVYTTKIVTQRPNPLLEDPFFRRFFGDVVPQVPRQRLENSLGSGVVVSDNGYILTNNHVIAGADQIEIALADGRTAQASVVGTDPDTDVAVLKIDLENVPTIVLGGSDNLRIGDVVLAIGNPFGVGQTVTMGIVSATGRSHLGISTYENFIQTDAAINPGNSGGALINAYGELIGVNTAIYSRSGGSQGIGFAIPVSLAKSVMTQIIDHGRAVRGWLGIETQDINPALAESFGLQDTRGIIVAGVLRGGPADQSGLQPGDVITDIDGKPVTDSRGMMNLVAQTNPGTVIEIRLTRNNSPSVVKATVGDRPLPRER